MTPETDQELIGEIRALNASIHEYTARSARCKE